MKWTIILLAFPLWLFAQPSGNTDLTRWKQQASRVTIIRDNWGIPHIYGKSDADAVFGLLYAQCEDDFPRVEANYIEKLGRQAEVNGNRYVYADLLNRMLLDSSEARKDYDNAPQWLKRLCNAFADGINFYLHTHPQVQPALLTHFEPWWPLLWTDGSIGAISTGGATAQEFQQFYSGEAVAAAPPKWDDDNEWGSNGFAFAPKLTQSGKAILYINPHVTFYFRPEVHIVSEEGLNAYGAVTWGQFFVYQGFNPYCGWMHTSSKADVADLYAEKITGSQQQFTYLYNNEQRKVQSKPVSITIKNGNALAQKTFTTYYTHHGPVIAKRDDSWLTLRHHNRSEKGLEQSWLRTKAKSFAEFKQVMYMKENTSNNTVYADKEGNIAYWHGNFMPRRIPAYDWSKPVDGTTDATEWKGLHMVDEMVTIYNPSNGWIQNCNSTPFTAAGNSSPLREKYPSYMAPDEENFRGVNAIRVWKDASALNIDKVASMGYTRYLPAFEVLIPALQKAWNNKGFVPDSSAKDMEAAMQLLADWNYESGTASIATTLAIEWGQRLLPAIQQTTVAGKPGADFVEKTKAFAAQASPDELLIPLRTTIGDLKSRFPGWQVPWGELNRYQRITGKLNETYSDSLPSIPVAFAAATWGALPSYVSRPMPGTQRRYGFSGNSFICAVEFGDRIKAKSLLAGGNSNDPASPHFGDQAPLYAEGRFKQVLFYKEDILKHAERSYHPGQ